MGETGRRFHGDMTVVRATHGLEAVRRVTRFSNDIAVHLVEVDVLPGPAWAEVSSESHARLTIVLDAIGGRVESRLKRNQAPANGPFTMNFAPPGTSVWGYSDGVRRVRDLRLDFDPARISEALGEKLTLPREPLVFRDERLRHLASCLAAECEAPGQFGSLYVDSLTLAACIDLLRLGSAHPARGPGRLAPWQLRRATEYLTEHLAEPVRLKQLADITGLSQSQFGRAFKASTGLSPHRWHLDARIAKAQRLLLSSSLPHAEIALATGFAEQSHFCRVFRNIVGTSPALWQRKHLRPRGA
jgi:AraC family transcriptional regulator